ncbi:MAG: hypothetical protein ACOCXH_06235 [Cyclobacteriaceae bacterium]
MKQIILLCLFIMATITANAQKTTTAKPMHDKDKEIKMSLNETQKYVLHQTFEQPTPENPYPRVSFYVYDLKNDKIVYQDNISRGKVSWHSCQLIKIWKVPGIVKHDQEPSDNYVYIDVSSGQKVKNPDQKGRKDI